MPTPMEALLKASVETRRQVGLKPGQPVRLGDLKSEYFKQSPAYTPPPSEKPQQTSRATNKAVSTPVTAPDKPLAEGNIEAMMKAFKEGRKKK